MRAYTIELELRSDVIQTSEASSLGVHHCLEYVKGSTLLGAAAAEVYDDLGGAAYVAFHSGKVRFLDAVLLADDGTGTLPVPFGWLHPKEQPFETGGVLAAESLRTVNHLAPGEAASLGLQQMRGGFFTPDGRWLSVARRYRLKSALDRNLGGRPDEGSLFGYESLPAGSRWRAAIHLDDDVDETIDEALRSVFDDRLVWLGRSRSAEYGRAHARIAPAALATEETPPSPGATVAVCLLSDTALACDETGEPTLTARPTDFGLPATWRLDPLRSAVLVRRYSPFNRKRRQRDTERLVLRRGSVLSFAGEAEADLAAARRHVAAGVGMYRQEGLGQVEVAPAYLEEAKPRFRRLAVSAARGRGKVEAPGPLAEWMLRRRRERQRSELAFEAGQEAADSLVAVVHKLRREKRLTPSRSQWNRLAGVVLRHLDRKDPDVGAARDELRRDLFAAAEGAAGVAANAWRAEVAEGRPFYELTLEKGLGPRDRDAEERLWRLCHTARLMVRRLSADWGEAPEDVR